jgi:hypothetical protein
VKQFQGSSFTLNDLDPQEPVMLRIQRLDEVIHVPIAKLTKVVEAVEVGARLIPGPTTATP